MSISLAAALAVMALSQLFKLAFYSLRERRLELSYLFATGGMPSAHSAFVTALAVSLGLWRGLGSETFAVCAVFAAIIVYDSVRLRGMVDTHTRILRDLQLKVIGSGGIDIPRWVGHSATETVVGIAVGAAAAVAAYFLLLPLYPSGLIGG